MGFSYFTYIAGIASLLGFALQVFDVFPKHAGFRKTLFLLILGIFLGTLLNTFNASNINFEVKITGFTLLVALFAFTIIGFLIAGAMTKEAERREELFAIGGIGFFAFIIVLLFGSLISGNVESPAIEKQKLTVSELIKLADTAEDKGDYDRAIMHLETIEQRLEPNDPRKQKLEERIDQTKDKQIK